jgi:hypothetical protein
MWIGRLPLCSDLVLRSSWKSSPRRRWSCLCCTCYSRPTSHRCQTPRFRGSGGPLCPGQRRDGRWRISCGSLLPCPLIASSGSRRCRALASSHGARIQTPRSSSVWLLVQKPSLARCITGRYQPRDWSSIRRLIAWLDGQQSNVGQWSIASFPCKSASWSPERSKVDFTLSDRA